MYSASIPLLIICGAVEPDDCFYIQNEAAIRGKKRLDLNVDPPPDLAEAMNISLKPEQEQFVQSQIQQGNFANPEQVIEAALHLLAEQSIGYEQWVKETREKIDVGLAQLERGEKFTVEVAFERLERKVTNDYQNRIDASV